MKVVIGDGDTEYTNRLVQYFTTHNWDQMELHVFSDVDSLKNFLSNEKTDAVVVSEDFGIQPDDVKEGTAFSYFSILQSVKMIQNQYAICKYQKAEELYQELLNLHTKEPQTAPVTKVLTFQSASGGVGVTTFAVACSRFLVNRGCKVLYLNLERIKSPDVLQPYEASEGILDMVESEPEKIESQISEIKKMKEYDYIIIDYNFDFGQISTDVCRLADKIIFIMDGSDLGDRKFRNVYAELRMVEQKKDMEILDKLYIMYNKFDSKTSKESNIQSLHVIGGLPKYQEEKIEEVILKVMRMQVFQLLM